MKRHQTTLIKRASSKAVEAELLEGASAELLLRTEEAWREARLRAALKAESSGRSLPEHWHWDWRKKALRLRLLAYRAFALECEGEIQGLMMVSTATHSARLEPDRGKPLIYIDYLESAPWNLRALSEEPRFSAVGLRLFEAAVAFSKSEGFFGRIGLHSLPQAEGFYESVCKATPLGPDASVQDLVYFELTRKGVEEFFKGGAS